MYPKPNKQSRKRPAVERLQSQLKFAKPIRKRNRNVLDKERKLPCTVYGCMATRIETAHIKSKGSRGDDAEWNVMPLCVRHHRESHSLGWYLMAQKYPRVGWVLSKKGWTFDSFNKVIRI